MSAAQKVDSLAKAVFEAYSRNSGNPPECHRDRNAAEQWMTQALEEIGITRAIEASFKTIRAFECMGEAYGAVAMLKARSGCEHAMVAQKEALAAIGSAP